MAPTGEHLLRRLFLDKAFEGLRAQYPTPKDASYERPQAGDSTLAAPRGRRRRPLDPGTRGPGKLRVVVSRAARESIPAVGTGSFEQAASGFR